MTLHLNTVAVSDPGLVRDNNEDTPYAGHRLIAVADGIGGQPAGEVASGVVIRVLSEVDGHSDLVDPVTVLSAAVHEANRQIRETAATDPACEGMGTTLTAVLLHADHLAVAHVGDSRCYLLRDRSLLQVTRDDTFVQALIDNGVLTVDQARNHPQRSLVTSAVQGGDISPSTGLLPARAGDRLLLCSDGLSDVVTDQAIAQILATYVDLRQCAEQLIKLAHQAGAPDNVTVVLADVVDV